MNPRYTLSMHLRGIARPLLLSVVVLAACGPDKNTTTTGDTTVDPPVTMTTTEATSTSTSTSTSSTTGTPTTSEVTTGKVPCDQPDPLDCDCAPGCGANFCVDGFWECECVACTNSEPLTDGDTSESSDTSPETTGGIEIDCASTPQSFPPLHNGPCEVEADCTVGFHQVDCCGTREAWGIAVVDVDAFDQAELVCISQFPICDCLPEPTVADDGKSGDSPDDFAAACLNNACLSFVP